MKKKWLLYLVALLCLLPPALMLWGSLRVGHAFSLRQYGLLLLQTPDFFRGFWNSLLYTAVILAVNVPLSLLAAYGFSRFRFRGREVLFGLYILMMLLPFQATVVPQYLMLKQLGILHTPLSVVLPNMFSTFGTFLMTQYMRTFDKALYEAAQMDGMSGFRIFLRIVMPVCRPIVYALTVLSFVNCWSLIEQPTTFLESGAQQPLSVLLSSAPLRSVAFAGGVVFSLLPLLFYCASFDSLKQGIGIVGSAALAAEDLPEQKHRRRPVVGRLVIGFLIGMAVFTLVSQKVGYIMLPRVAAYTASRPAPVPAGQHYVVPDGCITQANGQPCVYLLMEDEGGDDYRKVVMMSVSVLGSEGGYSALSGPFGENPQVVCFSSRTLTDGDRVVVEEEAFDEKGAD